MSDTTKSTNNQIFIPTERRTNPDGTVEIFDRVMRPHQDRIYVEMLPEKTHIGAFEIPATARTATDEGVIIAIGPDLSPDDYSTGDHVVLKKHGGVSEFDPRGKGKHPKFRTVRPDDILHTVEMDWRPETDEEKAERENAEATKRRDAELAKGGKLDP